MGVGGAGRRATGGGRGVITKDKAKLNVTFLQVQQQNNTIDCGLFLIAYYTEYYFTGKIGIVEAEFDRMRMQHHLLNCLENMEIVPFRELRRRLKLKSGKFHILDKTISVDCATGCGFPITYNDMIQCEMSCCSR